MFKDGDKALQVSMPRFDGARSYRVVEIGKVHKTGRIVLKGDTQQWRFSKAFGDTEQDYFTPCNNGWASPSDRVYPYCEKLLSEIIEEMLQQSHRQKLNRLGELMQRIKNDEEGSELWSNLPSKFHAWVEKDMSNDQ